MKDCLSCKNLQHKACVTAVNPDIDTGVYNIQTTYSCKKVFSATFRKNLQCTIDRIDITCDMYMDLFI